VLTTTGTSTPTLQAEEPALFNPAQIREFTPQGYDLSNSVGFEFCTVSCYRDMFKLIHLLPSIFKSKISVLLIIQQTAMNGSALESQVSYDPFTIAGATTSQASASGQYNPYLENEGNLAAAGAGYYPTQTTYTPAAQPVCRN